MNVIDTIQERLNRGYDGKYGDVLNDLSTVLILFRAKSRAIEQIDNELALLEDEAHGEWGNEITKLRKKLQ